MTVKRFSVVVFLTLFCFSNGFSQLNFASKQDVDNFFQNKLMVVESDKPFSFFNQTIKEAVKTHWKITPYDFVKSDFFEKERQNKNFSFLIFTEASFRENRQIISLDVLNIVLGKRGKDINDMPDLGSVPLSYADDDEDLYLYKMPALIKFIQYQIGVLSKQNISSPLKLIDYHNSFSNEIKQNTLWLLDTDLAAEANTINKIKGVYDYNFKIVSLEQLEDAINKESNILFLHKVAPDSHGKVWKFIISAKDGKAYYIGEHISKGSNENGLLLSDFKNFAK